MKKVITIILAVIAILQPIAWYTVYTILLPNAKQMGVVDGLDVVCIMSGFLSIVALVISITGLNPKEFE